MKSQPKSLEELTTDVVNLVALRGYRLREAQLDVAESQGHATWTELVRQRERSRGNEAEVSSIEVKRTVSRRTVDEIDAEAVAYANEHDCRLRDAMQAVAERAGFAKWTRLEASCKPDGRSKVAGMSEAFVSQYEASAKLNGEDGSRASIDDAARPDPRVRDEAYRRADAAYERLLLSVEGKGADRCEPTVLFLSKLIVGEPREEFRLVSREAAADMELIEEAIRLSTHRPCWRVSDRHRARAMLVGAAYWVDAEPRG